MWLFTTLNSTGRIKLAQAVSKKIHSESAFCIGLVCFKKILQEFHSLENPSVKMEVTIITISKSAGLEILPRLMNSVAIYADKPDFSAASAIAKPDPIRST